MVKMHHNMSNMQGRVHWLSLLHVSLCSSNKSWNLSDLSNLEGYLKGRFDVSRCNALLAVDVEVLSKAVEKENKKPPAKKDLELATKLISEEINNQLQLQSSGEVTMATTTKKKVSKKAVVKKAVKKATAQRPSEKAMEKGVATMKKKAAVKKKVSKKAAVKSGARNAVKKVSAGKAVKKTNTKAEDLMGKKITIKSKSNPKRGTAAVRFDLYKNGMTVEAYIKAGGAIRDVRWDVKQNFISIK